MRINTPSNYNYKYSNRGMNLEEEINSSNKYYLENEIAVIHKKPTPITINKVMYQSRYEAKIIEAYFKTPSTTDYNGVYKGRYIDFEAKETKSKTSFPLNNIHTHQIKHLRKIIEMGGIGFIIVRFTSLNETYYLNAKFLFSFLENENRKSIPLEYFKKNGCQIKNKLRPLVDYLEFVERDLR